MKKYIILPFLFAANLAYCMDAPKSAEDKKIEANMQLYDILMDHTEERYDAKQKLDKVKKLIGKCDINFRYPNKAHQTLLMLTLYRYSEIFRLLLTQPGVDITIEDQDGWTILFHALDRPEELKFLLEFKKKFGPALYLNKLNQLRTPLLRAIECQSLQAVALLCSQEEIDVNISNFNGSPLHQAMSGMDLDGLKIIRLLAERGALMECLNDKQQNPLLVAFRRVIEDQHCIAHNRVIALLALGAKKATISVHTPNAPTQIISIDNTIDVFSVMRDNGKYSIQYTEHGKQPENLLLDTCFKVAVLGVNPAEHRQLKDLFARIAHPNAKDAIFGMTALMWAAARGHLALAELLLTHPKMDVAVRDNFGWTALHYAALNGHEQIVEMLLTYPEAIGELKSLRGIRAIDLAKARNHKAVGRLLVRDQRKQMKIMQYFMQKPIAELTLPVWRFLPAEAALRILQLRGEPIGADGDKIRKIIELCTTEPSAS